MTELEAAVSELRRAVLTGGDTTEASHRLARASAAVEQLLHAASSASTPPTAEEPVTKSVTETRPEPEAREPSTPARAPEIDPTPRPEPFAAHPFRSVTKPITEADRPPPIDPATVRVERNTNDPAGPRWRVLAGDANNPTLIGFATAGYTATGNRSSSRWKAIATGGLILRNDARSRAHAVAVVLDSYLRAAGVRPKLLS